VLLELLENIARWEGNHQNWNCKKCVQCGNQQEKGLAAETSDLGDNNSNQDVSSESSLPVDKLSIVLYIACISL
jgi:hypothetical protein